MKLVLATWNVRTLLDRDRSQRPERRTALVARELQRYNIDIAALSETRFADDGQLTENLSGYTFFWKGRPESESRESGVGFAIRNTLLTRLDRLPEGVSDRIMKLRLPLSDNKRHATLISVYAPTMTNPESTKENFYDELRVIIDSTPPDDRLIILGDFNARVGQDYQAWQGALGRHGTGKMNSNGLMLLTMCSVHNLAITNTFFRLAGKHKTTWMHPRSKHWHLIDYVITRQRDIQDFTTTRVLRGADCSTDHRLVRSILNIQIKPRSRHAAALPPKRLNVNLLRNDSTSQALANNLSHALAKRQSSGLDVDAEWSSLRDVLYRTTTDTIGLAKRRHADWFDENDANIMTLLDARDSAHKAALSDPLSASKQASYKSTCATLQRNLRQMKNDWFIKMAEDIQSAADRKDYKTFYDGINQIYGPRKSSTSPMLSADGTSLLADKTAILERWKEHFDSLLKCPSSVSDESILRIPDRLTLHGLDDPPTFDEIQDAIGSMKNNKSPGMDGIPAEVYKHGGPALTDELHKLFSLIWTRESVPQEFKDSNILPIYKRKGGRSSCDNYRGISLLSTAGKILARILLRRLLENVTENTLSELQCGFRPGRGTSDMIFVARQLQEKSREQNQPLYMIFLDLTKAFDTVNREGLWLILQKFGCPDRFIKIIRSFHDGMFGRVMVDGVFSEAFVITNGLKQGCVLAAILFALFYAAMLNEAMSDCDDGISIRFRSGNLFKLSRLRADSKVMEILIQELLYADDCALVASTESALQRITNRFATAALNFGLTISLSKTEVLFQPPPAQPHSDPSINIYGGRIKSVKQFTYLGSTLNAEANIDNEVCNRTNKAASAFGRLHDRVWKPHDIQLGTKVKVYNAVVLSTLLYGCETWTCYSRHVRQMEHFHMKHLRYLMGIRWQDKMSNLRVLELTGSSSIHSWLIRSQMRWTGHIIRMPQSRMPFQLLYGELSEGKRNRGGQRKRFKDTLKANMKKCAIHSERLEQLASDRNDWRLSISSGIAFLENQAITEYQARKDRRAAVLLPAQPSETFKCDICGQPCRSRIGLWSHKSARHRP